MRNRDRIMKQYGRRALSLFLCIGLLLPSARGAYAQEAAQQPEDAVYLPSSRISKDKLPQGDVIYFGTASATVEEKAEEYAVKLYREGDLEKEASVELHTVDMTAIYGKDYELCMDGVTETGNGKSILENYVKGREITHTDDMDEQAVPKEEQKNGRETEETENDGSVPASSVSLLAKEKEERTGEKARELSSMDNESESLADALTGELVADSMSRLDYSSRSSVTFEKGESEKTVKFRILEDEETEGTESFSVLLVNPEEAELYEVTSLSVSIQDAQEAERSKVSFTEEEYVSKEGKANVTIERTGAEYSVCELALRTSGESAVAGENYEEKNELVSFAPYETEKTIEMDVAGNGAFQVALTDFTACEEGERAKAKVLIQSEPGSPETIAAQTAGSSFDINIKGHAYTVEYTEGEATGRIMDNDYEPPVQAGTYYFAADKEHGGMFTYGHLGGDAPSWLGHRDTDYQSDGKYGRLRYYSPTAWHKGWSYGQIRNLPGVYYNYFIPDWDTEGSTDGGQRKIEITGADTKYSHGAAGRTQNQNAVVNTQNKNLSAEIYAYDDSGLCRKSYIKLYGLCAMNRKFNISMQPVGELTFRTGKQGSSVSAPPVQVEVDCGAQPKDASLDSRDIYANEDPDKSNLVFSAKDTYVNGHYGIFGHITGYQITVDPGKGSDKIRTLNYPQDFETWLSQVETRKVTKPMFPKPVTVMKEYPKFPKSEVEAEIKKIRANLDTVPYDQYFLQWIGEMQGDTASDPMGYGYKQNLKFKPIVEHNKVTVEVLPPKGEGTGHFTDGQLSKTGKYDFYAGDSLDLSAVANDADNYEVTGYQVSVDGVNFNTITDGSSLFLGEKQDMDYYRIRPVIQAKANAIEVRLDKSASSHFEIQGLIPQSELSALGEAYDYLKGKNVLNVNPAGKTALEKMTPVPGKEYMVRILQKGGENKDTEYRPSVKKKSGNTVYTTRFFQFIAESDPGDNIIEIGVKKTSKDDLHTYAVTGSLVSAYAPVRRTALEVKRLPVAGYTLSAGTGKQNLDANGKPYAESVSTVSDETGRYVLTGITGAEGDVIPVFVSNGMTNGQIIDVKLTGQKEDAQTGAVTVTQENTDIKYPYHAPKVTSIDYTYDNAIHVQQNGGVAPDSVNVYDDIFTVTAAVDTYGRTIKEAVFTVYTVTGKTTTYYALEDEDNPDHFVCKIPGMADSIFNGDRIKVKLVDSEKMYSEAGKDFEGNDILNSEGEPVTGIARNIEYPDVDTGLVFYVENVLIQPKYYDVQDNTIAADIPLVGNATASTQSGLLTFGKNRWADGNGYTLQIGANFTYGNTATPSGEQKAAMTDNILNALRSDKANAEEIILGKKEGSSQEGKTDLKAEKKEVQKQIKAMQKDNTSKAKEAVTKMNEKEPMWKVDDAIVLVFDFLYNPEIGDYQFISGGVAVGGTFTFNMTTYGIVASVPAFINFSATLQSNLTVSYATETGQKAMTAGDFDSYAGNLAERLSGAKATQSVMASGKVQVGAGLCGVLSARGYVALKVQFDLKIGNLAEGEPRGGALIGFSGGIGFDLLIISINLDFWSVTKGWGSLASKTSYDFFGGLLDESDLGIDTKSGRQALLTENGDRILKSYSENEALVEHAYDAGTSDLSGFGRSPMVRATPGLAQVHTILDDAAERTRPQIIALDDTNTEKMIIFIANRGKGEEQNKAALFYSVYDGMAWGQPKLLDDDGTVDCAPDMIRGTGADGKEKVMIAWADANREFAEADGAADKLNTLGISAKVYDIESGTMGEEIVIIDDRYFNLSPKLNAANGVLYCSYMKRDLSRTQEEEDFLNFNKTYSTMAYVAYDLNTGDYLTGMEDYHEELMTFCHPELTDPLVMDYQSVTAELDGDSYLLSAYTVDGDTDLATKEDRELFLQIQNLTQDKTYYPIQATNDAFAQSSPKLTDLDGTAYLTWLNDGYLFQLLDVSKLLEALFGKSTEKIEISAADSDGENPVAVTIDKDVFRNGNITSWGNGARAHMDWYKKSAADLGITNAEYYKGSVYEDLANGSLKPDSANFSQREGMGTSISNYSVTSDGKDVYVFFTDFGTKDEKSAGVEIYGACYRRWMRDGSADEGGASDGISREQEWGFGKAVQITDNGKVIDELSLYMDKESNISAVSNYYEQRINANGGMSYGPNKLVEIEFVSKGSIEVEDGYIRLPERLTGGEMEQIEFGVANNGLLPAKGFQYAVYQVKGEEETFLDGGEITEELASGETREVTADWNIPQDISGMSIRVDVQETGVEQATVSSASVEVPYGGNLEVTEAMAGTDGKRPYFSATVKNTGNAAAQAQTASLGISGEDGAMGKIYKTVEIPALESGEEKTVRFPFEPAVEDFKDNMGVISLKFTVTKDGETAAEANAKFSSAQPVCAKINDGTDIHLEYGKTATLAATAAPWNTIAGEVRFYSADEAVATVDGQGVVTGTGDGDTEIFAYYPNSGVTAQIGVTVTGEPVKYSVTFYKNDGSGIKADAKILEGQKIGASDLPEWAKDSETHTFSGWFTDEACKEAYDMEDSVTNDLPLYAKWEKKVSEDEAASVKADEAVSQAEAAIEAAGGAVETGTRLPARTESGDPLVWSADSEYVSVGADGMVTVKEGLTEETEVTFTVELSYGDGKRVTKRIAVRVKPTVAVKQYTVTFNGAGGSPTPAKQTVTSGAKAARPNNPSRAGYRFLGWYLCGAAYNFNAPVTADIVLDARWEKLPEPSKNGATYTDKKKKITYQIIDEKKKTARVLKGANKKAKSVSIPADIEIEGIKCKIVEVGKDAFKGYKNMTGVTLGKNVKTIGQNAFSGCKKLRSVTLKGKTLKAGKNAFKGTAKNLAVKASKVKKKQKKTLEKALRKCGNKKLKVK